MSDAAAPAVELRDPIHGPIAVSGKELDVIDAPLFQRLRGVKQLGFAEFVFPGAVHNRYLHSIGAMHLGGRVFDAVARSCAWLDAPTRRRFRQLVRLAALLHDLGHAPLSHAAEVLMPLREDMGLERYHVGVGRASHEEMSLKLIADSPLTEVINRAFAADGITAEQVAAVVMTHAISDEDAATFSVGGLDHRPLLHALVSGELDVDRMDYLLRDSYFSGVRYGQYDLDWLLSNVIAVEDGDAARLGIDMRAVPTFEHFLLARYHMFQMVYFHSKSDIYDAMLSRWLEAAGPEARFPADPQAYVRCDDAWLMARLADTEDPWARRVRERQPLKLAAELRNDAARERHQELAARLDAAGIEALWLTARPVLSRYAQSPARLRDNPLFVRDWQGGRTDRYHRIEDVTDLFGRYEQTRRIERVYVAREDRPRAAEIVNETLAG